MAVLRHFPFAAFIAVIGTATTAQPSANAEYCSLYFQARADWLRTLDGNQATIETMDNYAEIMRYSVPRDDGILRGFSLSDTGGPEIITTFMTRWAEQGAQLPLCMEDVLCIRCTNTLRAVK